MTDVAPPAQRRACRAEVLRWRVAARYSEIHRHRVRAEIVAHRASLFDSEPQRPLADECRDDYLLALLGGSVSLRARGTTSAWMRAASEARAGVVCADSSPTETSKVSPLTRSRMATWPAGFTAQTITSREPWTAIVPQAMRRISIRRTMPGAAAAWRWQTYQWFTDTVERTIDELLTFLTDIPGAAEPAPNGRARAVSARRSSCDEALRAVSPGESTDIFNGHYCHFERTSTPAGHRRGGMHQMLQSDLHRLELLELFVQFLDVGLCQRAHLAAWALAVLPQPEQLTNLLDREAQVARLPNEPQRADFLVRVLSVARLGTNRLFGKSPTLS